MDIYELISSNLQIIILILITYLTIFISLYLYRKTSEAGYLSQYILKTLDKSFLDKNQDRDLKERQFYEFSKIRNSIQSFQDSLDKRLDALERQPKELQIIANHLENNNEKLETLVNRYLAISSEIPDSKKLGEKTSQESVLSIYKQVSSEFSHSIKTPMLGIEAIISTLKEIVPTLLKEQKPIDKDTSADILQMLENATLSMEYVDSILRKGAGFFPGEPENVSIENIIKKAVRLAKVGTNSKNEVAITLPAIPKVKFYSLNLLIPLITILENAFEVVNNSGLISITAEYYEKPEIVNIDISNNGVPISKEIIDKLLKENVSTKGPSRGYGLMAAVHCLQEVGGELKLIDTSDTETKFRISFKPIVELAKL